MTLSSTGAIAGKINSLSILEMGIKCLKPFRSGRAATTVPGTVPGLVQSRAGAGLFGPFFFGTCTCAGLSKSAYDQSRSSIHQADG